MKFNSILICTFVCFLDSGEEIHLCFFLIIIHFHMIPNGKINTKLAVSYNTSCIIRLELLESERDRDTMQVRLKPGSLETALTCLAYEHVPLRHVHFTKNLRHYSFTAMQAVVFPWGNANRSVPLWKTRRDKLFSFALWRIEAFECIISARHSLSEFPTPCEMNDVISWCETSDSWFGGERGY